MVTQSHPPFVTSINPNPIDYKNYVTTLHSEIFRARSQVCDTANIVKYKFYTGHTSLLHLSSNQAYTIYRREINIISGGGSEQTDDSQSSPQVLIIPSKTIKTSPIIRVSILTRFPTTSTGNQRFCCNVVIAYSKQRPEIVITSQDLRNLISHGKSTNDQTIYLFLEILCKSLKYTFLTEKFYTLLKRNGWQQVKRFFAQNKGSKGRSTFRPSISGEPAIAIPCFIYGCHWIAVVRREIQDKVYFLF
jgi:hypothetical protein